VIDGAQWDFFSVAEHEIDEVLGTGSYLDCIGSNIDCSGHPVADPADLFRYSSNSQGRSYTTAATLAYFSYDKGKHLSPPYNQTGFGDYGDWAHDCTPGSYYVQDTANCPGELANLGPEVPLLDAIGYDPVPEPAMLLPIMVTLTALITRYRWSRRRSPLS